LRKDAAAKGQGLVKACAVKFEVVGAVGQVMRMASSVVHIERFFVAMTVVGFAGLIATVIWMLLT
jgi:hypothetical protein